MGHACFDEVGCKLTGWSGLHVDAGGHLAKWALRPGVHHVGARPVGACCPLGLRPYVAMCESWGAPSGCQASERMLLTGPQAAHSCVRVTSKLLDDFRWHEVACFDVWMLR